MINFPLSVLSPTSFQIVSHLRPSPVENFGYHPGSLKPDMLVKRESVLELHCASNFRQAVGCKSDGFSLTSMGCTPAPNRRVAVSSELMARFEADGLPSPETRTFTGHDLEMSAPVEAGNMRTALLPAHASPKRPDGRGKLRRAWINPGVMVDGL